MEVVQLFTAKGKYGNDFSKNCINKNNICMFNSTNIKQYRISN